MQRMVLGAILALAMMGLGVFWWQGRAQVEQSAPPPPPLATQSAAPDALPSADVTGLRGPAPPEASDLTKEQQRFFRVDRNRDWRISRSEMLAPRTPAFKKLDKDGNNLLTFEEWAATTVDKFETADRDGNRELSPGEFATTKPKPAKKANCAC